MGSSTLVLPIDPKNDGKNIAIRLYGVSSFDFRVVKNDLTKKEAEAEERGLIQTLNLRNPDFGYNMTEGGEGGVPTEEVVVKICENKGMKKDPMCGDQYFRTPLPTREIVAEYKSGYSSSELAKKYGTDHGTIIRRLRASGVSIRTQLEGRRLMYPKIVGKVPDAEIVRLYNDGWSGPQIAKKVGMSKSGISSRLVRLIPKRRPCGSRKTE